MDTRRKAIRRAIARLSETSYFVPGSTLELQQDGQAPTEFRLLRKGENPSTKGTFLFDEQAAESVMAAWTEAGNDLTGDWEHAALSGGEAPASIAKWVPEVRGGELWATAVEWTARAKAQIEAREYRYFSPAFVHSDDGRVMKILNVALTNIPALYGLEPLAASAVADDDEPEDKENPMSCENCAALKAQLSAIQAELAALKATSDEEKRQMCTAAALSVTAPTGEKVATLTELSALRTEVLSLTGQRTQAEAIGALRAMKIAGEQVASLSQKLAELEQSKLDGEFDSLMELSEKEGLLFASPAKRDAVIKQAKPDGKTTVVSLSLIKTLREFGEKLPNTPRAPADPNTAGVLTERQKEIAIASGSDLKKRAEFEATAR